MSGVVVTGQRPNPDEVPDGWGIHRQFGVCWRIDEEMVEDSPDYGSRGETDGLGSEISVQQFHDGVVEVDFSKVIV